MTFQEFQEARCGYVRTLSPEQQEKARRRSLSYHNKHKDDPEYLEKKRAQGRAHYQANLEKQRARSRDKINKDRAKDPKKYNDRARNWRLANLDKVKVIHRKHMLKRKYNLSESDFEAMLLAQGGVCAVCGTSEPGGPYNLWNVDHCHATNKVRQLLCNGCNVGAGFFKHNPALLRKMADYLEEHK